MKPFVKLSSVLFLLTSLLSCKKYLAIEEVEGRFLVDQVFSSDSAANTAVAGIYRKWRDLHSSVFSPSVLCGLAADELKNYFSQQQSFEDYYSNRINPQNVALPWSDLYNIIYQSNACIEALQRSAHVSEKTGKYMLGEAKFIRAHCYFYLVNLFGDVPLLLTTDIKRNAVERRKPVDSVYKQIIEDLRDSDLLMENEAPSHASSQRLNQFTAKAFLARVYLFTAEWATAYELSNQVIQSERYRLLPDLDSIFLQNSGESIFQFSNNNLDGIGEARLFIPGATPNLVCSNSLISCFESNDLRMLKWIKSGNYGGVQYFFPYKYKARDIAQNELYTLFRLAEQYLIRAESSINLLNTADGINDINIIRERSGLLPLPTNLSKDSGLSVLIRERRVEMFAETGHRWFDLKRAKVVDEIMKKEKGDLWIPSDALFPIPAADIQRNPNLIQNPPY